MGWFWESKDEKKETEKRPFSYTERDKGHQQLPEFQQHSSFYSSSTSRQCRTDPNDNKYMICKEVTKKGDTTTEKEERVPKGETAFSIFNTKSPFEELFKISDEDIFGPSNMNGFFGGFIPFMHPHFVQEQSQQYRKQSHNNKNTNHNQYNQYNENNQQKYFTTDQPPKSSQIRDF